MKILLVGNMGYVGPCVSEQLKKSYPEAQLIGLDTGYFAHCLTGVNRAPEWRLDKQYYCDVRDVQSDIFNGISKVIYLAAISNDPMGTSFEKPTYMINYESALKFAKNAKRAGADTFVFASSCSTYGAASDEARSEDAPLNPLTAYARSKVSAEQALKMLADKDFSITCLRFATACGMSDRLRLDLVLNDFVASAAATKNIKILSDGTPRRPLIHIRDMARAVDWAISRKSTNGDRFLTVNVGRDDWNFQVKDLAFAVAEIIPDVTIEINKDAQPDKRSYKVDFSLFRSKAPKHQPEYSLEDTIKELYDALKRMNFNDRDFRNSQFIRLKVLQNHIENGRLDSNLIWQS